MPGLRIFDREAQRQCSLHEPLVKYVRGTITPCPASAHVGERGSSARFEVNCRLEFGYVSLCFGRGIGAVKLRHFSQEIEPVTRLRDEPAGGDENQPCACVERARDLSVVATPR